MMWESWAWYRGDNPNRRDGGGRGGEIGGQGGGVKGGLTGETLEGGGGRSIKLARSGTRYGCGGLGEGGKMGRGRIHKRWGHRPASRR